MRGVLVLGTQNGKIETAKHETLLQRGPTTIEAFVRRRLGSVDIDRHILVGESVDLLYEWSRRCIGANDGFNERYLWRRIIQDFYDMAF